MARCLDSGSGESWRLKTRHCRHLFFVDGRHMRQAARLVATSSRPLIAVLSTLVYRRRTSGFGPSASLVPGTSFLRRRAGVHRRSVASRLPLKFRVWNGPSAAAMRHGDVRQGTAPLRGLAAAGTTGRAMFRRRPRLDAVAAGAVRAPRPRTSRHQLDGRRLSRGRQRRLAAGEKDFGHARVLGEAVDTAKAPGGCGPCSWCDPRRRCVEDDSRHGAR